MQVKEPVQKIGKGERTRLKLFETASRLFDKYDLDNVTVDTIVEEAGVSKGTFYIYFESKDELIASFIAEYINTVDADYKTYLDSLPPNTTAHDMMLFLIEKIADMLIDTIGYNKMSTVYKVQLTRVVNMEAVKGYNRKLYQIFDDVLKKGMEQGEFDTKLPIENLTKHFVMAIRGLSYEWCIRYPDFDLKEEALAHFRILLNGIRKSR